MTETRPRPDEPAPQPRTPPSAPSASRFRTRHWTTFAAASRRCAGPPRELVADRSQGVQLATMQELARYWATEYDWRKVEARLNALPQFTTQIDGVDIHFLVSPPTRRRCR